MENSKVYTADILRLARYGVDAASTILNKITRLMEECGLDYKYAVTELEDHYKNSNKEEHLNE